MENNEREIDIGFKLENSYAKLSKVFFSNQYPDEVPDPKLIILNESLCKELGLDISKLDKSEIAEVFSGNIIPKGSVPISQAYAGHQFGSFTMLGDGRAVLLGEYITPDAKRFDIQLKGSGDTLYSRGGDGKATLGAMLREYIISEAMFNLRIPTTRSLSVALTGEKIIREDIMNGAVLVRVASSHIRVGTFQYIYNWGSVSELKELADYTIDKHYPYISQSEDKYRLFLRELIKKQAQLISKWQLIGFIHGVMNTDNMTVSGETIDYGPCAFMDTYYEDTVFSSIDREGRYAYKNQPVMGKWNLARFAETLIPLINSLLVIMEKNKLDFTNTFYYLTSRNSKYSDVFDIDELKNWELLWKERLSRQEESYEESIELMKKNNPVVIPRNHQVEKALEAAVQKGDYSVMNELLDALSKPYDYSRNLDKYTEFPKKINKCYKTYCGT